MKFTIYTLVLVALTPMVLQSMKTPEQKQKSFEMGEHNNIDIDETSFDKLDDNILGEIFQHLPLNDLVRLGKVSKKMHKLVETEYKRREGKLYTLPDEPLLVILRNLSGNDLVKLVDVSPRIHTLVKQVYAEKAKYQMENFKKVPFEYQQVWTKFGTRTEVTLNLAKKNIQFIYPGAFYDKHFTQVTVLRLSNNQLEYLDKDAFKGLTNLTLLDLSENLLKRLDANLFYRLRNLTDLYLSFNLLRHLDKDAFKGVTKLLSIGLDNNPLVLNKLNKNIFKETALLQIIIDEQQEQNFDPTIFSLSKELIITTRPYQRYPFEYMQVINPIHQ